MNSHKFNQNSTESMKEIFNKRITIYGSYYPKETFKRMKNLKVCLRKRNFSNVKLVIDYPRKIFPSLHPDKDIRNLERSRHCLKISDLNLIIFTLVGIDSGITTEFLYSLQKRYNFLLLCEQDENDNIAGSSLIRGRLKELSKNFITFAKDNDEELCDVAFQRIIDFFL